VPCGSGGHNVEDASNDGLAKKEYPVGFLLHCSKLKKSTRREDVWGSGNIAPPFLTSALYGGEWSVSLSRRFILGETTPGTNCVEGWVGRRARLDAMDKEKMLTLPGIEPQHSNP
jgi:hypothetical protein